MCDKVVGAGIVGARRGADVRGAWGAVGRSMGAAGSNHGRCRAQGRLVQGTGRRLGAVGRSMGVVKRNMGAVGGGAAMTQGWPGHVLITCCESGTGL